MPAPTRHLRLAGGLVEVHGEGRLIPLLEQHLGPPVGARTAAEILVRIAAVDPPVQGAGMRVRSRRGDAVISDGAPVELRWAHTSRTVRPLLIAAHLAAKRRGAVLLHGAAVTWDGRSAVVVTGRSGAGKTATLLAAVASGATALAADWSWIDTSDMTLWPLPQPVRVRPHHLALPGVAGLVGPGRRARLRAVGRTGARFGRRVVNLAHVDVPLSAVNRRRCAADATTVLRAVLVLGDGDGTPMRLLSDFTGDGLTGTSSDLVMSGWADRLDVRLQPAGPPEAVAMLARELAR